MLRSVYPIQVENTSDRKIVINRIFYNQFVKHLTNYFGVDTPYRDADFQQAQDRIYRIGQDTEVFIYILTIDTGNEPNIITHNKEIMEWSDH